MRTKLDEPTWRKIREKYETTKISCRVLAGEFGISQHTVSTRCKRERWRKTSKFIEQRLSRVLEQKLEVRANSLADRAEKLVARTLDEAEDWLDRIQTAKKLLAEGDGEGLKELLNAWEVPIRNARKALRLDDVQESKPSGLVSIVVNTQHLQPSEPIIDIMETSAPA